MHPTKALIDLDALAENYHSAKRFVGGELAYLAVVKANAYGHGAVACAKRLEREGVDWLGVAFPDEGVELRNAGLSRPILILGSFRIGDESTIVENGLTPTVFDLETARSLSRYLGPNSADIHIKIDTGMGRLGARYDGLDLFLRGLSELTNLNVSGVMTHLASADDPSGDDHTRVQIERFKQSLNQLSDFGLDPTIIDIANTPGAIIHEGARVGMVRLGGALYGLLDDMLPLGHPRPVSRPVMSLVSLIAGVKAVPADEGVGYGLTFMTQRDSILAQVPIGYADGYPRQLSNGASVIVRNHLAPVVGRISMDWTVIDITDIPDAAVGDEAILIGGSDSYTITSADLAARTGTISYDITCGIGRRVERIYLER